MALLSRVAALLALLATGMAAVVGVQRPVGSGVTAAASAALGCQRGRPWLPMACSYACQPAASHATSNMCRRSGSPAAAAAAEHLAENSLRRAQVHVQVTAQRHLHRCSCWLGRRSHAALLEAVNAFGCTCMYSSRMGGKEACWAALLVRAWVEPSLGQF